MGAGANRIAQGTPTRVQDLPRRSPERNPPASLRDWRGTRPLFWLLLLPCRNSKDLWRCFQDARGNRAGHDLVEGEAIEERQWDGDAPDPFGVEGVGQE